MKNTHKCTGKGSVEEELAHRQAMDTLTPGHPMDRMRSNYAKAGHPFTPTIDNDGLPGWGPHGYGRGSSEHYGGQ